MPAASAWRPARSRLRSWLGAQTGDAAPHHPLGLVRHLRRLRRRLPGGRPGHLGRGMTAGEVVETVLRQKAAYRWSGGGVTLSGGEPTLQLRFSRAILQACHAEGVHTALETCGCAPWSSFESLLPGVDIFLFDLKHMDAALHRGYTGVSNRHILANFARLVGAGAQVVARVPLIPGHTDDEENIAAIAGFVRSSGGNVVSLLPYNGAAAARYA